MPDERIIVGRVVGLYGVRGWVRVRSYTEPPENILNYSPWELSREGRWEQVEIDEARRHGKGIVARFVAYPDRDAARRLIGMEIGVGRKQLPRVDANDFYWADLVGLAVVTVGGVELGRVDRLLATGANDVLVAKGKRDRLIPFVEGAVVKSVDLEAGQITVDWDPEF